MKKLYSTHLYAILYSLLFLFPYTMLPVYNDGVYISQSEVHEILENIDRKYVYLGRELSDLYDVIVQVSEFDEDKDSVVWQLKKHIEDGHTIGLHDVVMEALEYAANILERKNSAEAQSVSDALVGVMYQVFNEALTPLITELGDKEIDGTRKKLSSYPFIAANNKKDNHHTHAPKNPFLHSSSNTIRVLEIREIIEAFENAKFKDDVKINKNLVVKGNTKLYKKLQVCGESVFKEDVEFENNVLIEGNLTVDGTVNFMGTTVISLTDVVIGNLSATDIVVLNLSATDATIANLTVTNETVSNLSATTVSVGCELIVGCNIELPNSTDAAHGNIIKGGNSFLSDFGTDNTFVGSNAGNFTMVGTENSGFGNNTLFNNTVGSDNTALGAFSMLNNTEGNQNVAVGSYTLQNNITGSGNTILGYQAGSGLLNGNNNVLVGNNAGVSLATGDDNIYLSNSGVAAETGIIRIGTSVTHTAAFIQGIFGSVVGGTGIAVFCDATGQLGTVVSSRRFKHDIADMTSDVSENIYKLRPVTFVYNSDESDTQQYGLIAEEVDSVLPALVVHDEEGQPYTVRYHILPMLLLNEVQKFNSIIQDQAITINDQAVTINELKSDNKKFGEIIEMLVAKINDLNR